jgi:general secretion pathway protein I
MKRSMRGFTLIEVLVALAIVGVALAATMRASGALVSNSAALRMKLYATWSAENALAEVRLVGTMPDLGEREFECPQGKAALVCVQVVKTTDNTNFRRVEISVYADATHDWRLVKLATVVGNAR